MLLLMLMAAGAAIDSPQEGSSAPSTLTPMIVVKGHLSKTPAGQTKVDTSIYIDDEDVSEQYGPIWPAQAWERRVNGRVTLTCRINGRGFAQSCDVASESPVNMGFGQAALQLQPSLRVSPPNGVDASGSITMNIGVSFEAPLDVISSTRWGLQSSRRTGEDDVLKSVTMMDHPVWSAAPSFDDMRKAYPVRVLGKEDFVVLRCNVDRSGSLKGCDVTKEEQGEREFSQAALSLATLFHVAPDVMAKAPRAKTIQVVLPIHFTPPQPEPEVFSPSWISGVDPKYSLKMFPPEAVEHGLTTGRGIARCFVGPDGSLTRCAPEEAGSDGLGFSDAAVVVASTMKMNLWSADAAPVCGGVARISVRFNLAPPT